VAITLRRRREGDPEGIMSVWEHLDELRKRLFLSMLAVALGMIGGWFLYPSVFRLVTNAFCTYMTAHPELAVNPADPCKLFFVGSPTEPFLIKLKVVAFLGLIVALPVVLYQLWRFITPGLMPKERRYAVPFVFFSLALFSLGGWMAFQTLPRGLNFLLGFAGSEGISVALSFPKYMGFVTVLVLAFGAAFEFPVVLVSLTLVGVLSSQKLRQWRRYALILSAVFAAVVTPTGDAFTMSALMLPMVIFYEASILIARILKK
jgi:sec-independent protein translocase protein TatC